MIKQSAGTGRAKMNDHPDYTDQCPRDRVDERTKEVLDRSQKLLIEARGAVEETRRLIERTSRLIHGYQDFPRRKGAT